MAKNRDRLKEFVKQIIANKGVLLIPAFAIGRTQTLLYELNELIEKGELPRVPVIVDSPLGINITGLYRRHDECFDEDMKKQIADGDQPFDFPGLRETRGWQDSQRLGSTPGPMIIIAGSGMMNGGRILGHLKTFAGRKSTMILVVGYQSHGTLGRKLLEGATEITIEGVPIHVQAKVKAINGFSAHADRDELIAWLDAFGKKPESAYCVHGEGTVVDSFAKTLADRFQGMKTFAPALGESLEI
jgi:metallo-beta-lactamase family protein